MKYTTLMITLLFTIRHYSTIATPQVDAYVPELTLINEYYQPLVMHLGVVVSKYGFEFYPLFLDYKSL